MNGTPKDSPISVVAFPVVRGVEIVNDNNHRGFETSVRTQRYSEHREVRCVIGFPRQSRSKPEIWGEGSTPRC